MNPLLYHVLENILFLSSNISLWLLFLAETQCPLQGETDQFKANHNDKVRVQEVKLWHPACHDVSPTGKELVSFSLHGSCCSIKKDGELVA